MMGASVIREGRLEDLERIVEFQCAMAWETESLRLDPATVTLGVRAVLTDSSKGRYWLVDQDGRAVACLLTIPEWSDWRNGTVLWIHSLYVVPELRRTGVFKKMYTELRGRVENDPALRGLRLYVEQANTRAQAVYDALGMSRDHYYLYEWLKG